MKLAVIVSIIAIATALPNSDEPRGRALFRRKGKSHKHSHHSHRHGHGSHGRSYSRGRYYDHGGNGRRILVVEQAPVVQVVRAPSTRVVQSQNRPVNQGNSNGGQYRQYQGGNTYGNSINQGNQAPIVSQVPSQQIDPSDPSLLRSSSIRIVGSLAAVAAVFLLL
jgi:hypothetical protein